MSSAHLKTLIAIFTDPVSPGIRWAAVEALLIAAGCRLIEGAGSRVSFEKAQMIASFYRPHPGKEAKRYQIKDAREYLTKLGVTP